VIEEVAALWRQDDTWHREWFERSCRPQLHDGLSELIKTWKGHARRVEIERLKEEAFTLPIGPSVLTNRDNPNGGRAPEQKPEEVPESPVAEPAAAPMELDEIGHVVVPAIDSTKADHPVLDVGPDFSSEPERNAAVTAYTTRWSCSEASLARTATVDPADLSKWKKGLLPATSDKLTRIEKALRNNDEPIVAQKRQEN
jgi:hypothetical protein